MGPSSRLFGLCCTVSVRVRRAGVYRLSHHTHHRGVLAHRGCSFSAYPDASLHLARRVEFRQNYPFTYRAVCRAALHPPHTASWS